jgi:hypothetical protein
MTVGGQSTVAVTVNGKLGAEYCAVTDQQLEQRLIELEREVAELRRELRPLRPLGSVEGTFGMFADDPEFDEIVELGREFRQQANEDSGC